MNENDGRRRVFIEGVKPEIDGGRFPIKRTLGDRVVVEADIFIDGADAISAALYYRREDDAEWIELPMEFLVNDRWQGTFSLAEIGRYTYTLAGWIDKFKSWSQGFSKKVQANQEVSIDLLIGAQLIEDAGQRASNSDSTTLQGWVDKLRSKQIQDAKKVQLALSEEVSDLVSKYPDMKLATRYPKELTVVVDPQRARFSAWYEMFPRSCASEAGKHGTLKDVEARLPYIADMAFDVLYLPPIHPIGVTHRKGKNNTTTAKPEDPGSPWAIGGKEGGHKAVHPQLGTLEDFRSLVVSAKKYGIEIALDMAFQGSPDHPYVEKHPDWFRHRPDGTIQYAENPPKRYEDIYPFEFETETWQELWEELKSVFMFWIEQGVHIFRVDNPHTKPLRFWEWVISEVKKSHPDVIFLAEAFTRPKVMQRLAKSGFSQSYTYFAWRNTKWELTQYLTELTQTDLSEYLRPNFWPNTPDILTEGLQFGRRPAFMSRLVLAATLTSAYGIYGPAFELCEREPREPGAEEYLDSEKFEIKRWEVARPDSLKNFIGRVNQIRRDNPALQTNQNLVFHNIGNDQLICYSKHTKDLTDIVLVVVNLDPHHTQSGWVELSLEELGLAPDEPYQAHDLLSGARYLWHGERNYIELNPSVVPAHIFRLRHRLRTERDFDYYL